MFCKYKQLNELRESLGREPTDREIDGLLLPDENRPHIYWECQYVRECIHHVHNSLWGGVEPVDKKAFLMGKEMATVEATMLYMLTNMCIKYRIWKYKLAGIIPKPNCIANDVKNWLENLTWYHKWRIMLPLVRRQVYE